MARLIHGTFQQIFYKYEMMQKYGFEDAELMDMVPGSWIYPYRTIPGFITMTFEVLGGRPVVKRRLQQSTSYDELVTMMNDAREAIIDRLVAAQKPPASPPVDEVNLVLSCSEVSDTVHSRVEPIDEPKTFSQAKELMEIESKSCDFNATKFLYKMLPVSERFLPSVIFPGEQQRVEFAPVFELAIYSPPLTGVEEFLIKNKIPFVHQRDLFSSTSHAPIVVGHDPCMVHYSKKMIAIWPSKAVFEDRMFRAGYTQRLAWYSAFLFILRLCDDVRQTDEMASSVLRRTDHVPWIC